MVQPRRSNPNVPCGVSGEWVMSTYGHIAVLDKEGPLTTTRMVLIGITILLGIFHFIVIYTIYKHHRSVRQRQHKSGIQQDEQTKWDHKVLFWLLLSGIGRYYHFIDNHYQPEAYHDGDRIYCGVLFADTDVFVPWQIVHIFIGLYATNEMFAHQKISNNAYKANILYGCISCVGFLHYCIEPIWYFAFAQQLSIWGEGLTGLLLMYWTHHEHNKEQTATEQEPCNDTGVETVPLISSNSSRVVVGNITDVESSYTEPLAHETVKNSVRRRSRERDT